MRLRRPGVLAVVLLTGLGLVGCASPTGAGAPSDGAAVAGSASASSPTGSPSVNSTPTELPRRSASVPASGDSAVGLAAPCPPTEDLAPVPGGLPRLTMACLGQGEAVHLAGLRGTPVVVNLWASWCGYCIEEIPLLSAYAARAAGRVVVLGVAYQDVPADAARAVTALRPGYASVLDPRGLLVAGRAGLPVTLLVDASGRVVRTVHGAFTDESQIDELVERYLGVAA